MDKKLHLLCNSGIEITPPIDDLEVGDWASLVDQEIAKAAYYDSCALKGIRGIDDFGDIIMLDDGYAALIYRDSDLTKLKGIIFKKDSETSITAGSAQTIYSAPGEIIYEIKGCAKLSPSAKNTALICIGEKNTSTSKGEGVVILFQRSGTSFVNIVTKMIYSVNWTYTKQVIALSDTLFAIGFQSIQNANEYLICMSISGTSLGNVGNLVDLYPSDQGGAQVHSIPMCRISATSFLVLYFWRSQSLSQTVYDLYVMNISGTSITKSKTLTIPEGISGVYGCFEMMGNKIVICGYDTRSNPYAFSYCVLTVSGSTITDVSEARRIEDIGSNYVIDKKSDTQLTVITPVGNNNPQKSFVILDFDGDTLTINRTTAFDNGDNKYNLNLLRYTGTGDSYYIAYGDYTDDVLKYKLALIDPNIVETAHTKYYGICAYNDGASQVIATSGACPVNIEGVPGRKTDNNVGVYIAKNVVELIDVLNR